MQDLQPLALEYNPLSREAIDADCVLRGTSNHYMDVKIVQIKDRSNFNTAETTWLVEISGTSQKAVKSTPELVEAALDVLRRQLRDALDPEDRVKFLTITALNARFFTL